MLKTIKPIILLTCLGTTLFAQTPTVGLVWYDGDVSEGYTLFTPSNTDKVFLINECGQRVNEWSFSNGTNVVSYILDGSEVLRASTTTLEVQDWYGNLVWSYPTMVNGINQHHDVEPLPNGNVLCIVSKLYSESYIIESGRNPSLVDGEFKMDGIIELQPIGTDSAEIVWEWWFADHLIQDFDASKSNYGTVADHPELVDINIDHQAGSNWTHVNSIDYNVDLDQIIVSARNLSEIFIIDHSTTTQEASGHIGGNAGKGGDILWRWGNVLNYGQGSVESRKLYRQHDARWVNEEYQNEGSISVFNNDGDGSGQFSSVHLIDPPLQGYSYQLQDGEFLPLDFEWTWSGSILGDVMYEQVRSGTQALPNGNFLIIQSSIGQISEVTQDGDIVWVYRNPFGWATVFDQYENIPVNGNALFKAVKYQSDYIGFNGVDLTPNVIIENENNLSAICSTSTGIEEKEVEPIWILNPSSGGVIQFNRYIERANVWVTDVKGRQVFANSNFEGSRLPVRLKLGIYIIHIDTNSFYENQKLVVID